MAVTNLVFPRESVEFVALDVADGTTAVTAYETAVIAYGKRPTSTDWHAAYALSDARGVLLSGLTPGAYLLWVRVTANPEIPVIRAGVVIIT